jgi:hypothetical protein
VIASLVQFPMELSPDSIEFSDNPTKTGTFRIGEVSSTKRSVWNEWRISGLIKSEAVGSSMGTAANTARHCLNELY